MTVPVVAVELCIGRPAGGRAATAMSKLSAVACWLGWLLAVGCARHCWSNGSGFGAHGVQPVGSHALLPDLVLARRLDVDVIGRGLATKLTGRLGWGRFAEQLNVPLRRSPPILNQADTE